MTEPLCDPDALFLKACRGEPVPRPPVWLMRQAGRFQKSYRAVREKTGFLELCRSPDLVAQVTLAAVEELQVDAAIIFADILLILEPLGLRIEFAKGEGPVVHDPIREPRDLARLKEPDLAALDYVYEAVRRTRRQLSRKVPLIGFAGAPFTLACYAIEGGPSKDFVHVKRLLWQHPEAFRELLLRFARAVSGYLSRQVEAGVQVVQLFDTWAGVLSEEDYRASVLAASRAAIQGVSPRVPVIHFGLVPADVLGALAHAGGDVVGVPSGTDLAVARRLLGSDRVLQGNLDPAALFCDRATIERHVRRVLDAGSGGPHVFNLGHGIIKDTPEESVRFLVERVKELSS